MGSMKLLKRDALGRVRTLKTKREEILDEFEGSGVSGAEFAALTGIKYPTLASWIQRRRRERGAYGRKGPVKPDQGMRFLETVVEKAAACSAPLEVELPGGARVRIADAGQVPLAVQLVRGLAAC
jgi:hypothetical protein